MSEETLDAEIVEEEAMPSALVKAQGVSLASWEGAADRAIVSREQRQRIVKEVLVKDEDYGTIPGCGDKPVLYKSGAEKITDAMMLWSDFQGEKVVEDFDRPLFFYRYRCTLRARGSDVAVASGIGSCNSMEGRHAFIWVPEHDIPSSLDKAKLEKRDSSVVEFDFAIQKAETSGKYGKPKDYWDGIKQAISEGRARRLQKETRGGKRMDAWEVPNIAFRIPNPEVFTLVNTIDKMAQKRSLVAAVLFLGFSQQFAQDVEDNPETFRRGAPPPVEPERQQAPPVSDETLGKMSRIRDIAESLPDDMKPAPVRAEIKEPQRKSAKGTKAELVDDNDIKWLTDLALQHKIKNRRVMAFIGEKFRHGDGTAKKARELTKKEFATVCAYVEEGSVSEALKKRVADNAVKYGVSMEFVREHCYKTWECQPKHLSPAELVTLTEWIVGFEEPA